MRPLAVTRALRKLGMDLKDARRRRRLPTAVVAERADISRMTLTKIEKGDAGVAMGTYATVMFVLGLVERVSDLADPAHDAIGMRLSDERLPRRVRLARPVTDRRP